MCLRSEDPVAVSVSVDPKEPGARGGETRQYMPVDMEAYPGSWSLIRPDSSPWRRRHPLPSVGPGTPVGVLPVDRINKSVPLRRYH